MNSSLLHRWATRLVWGGLLSSTAPAYASKPPLLPARTHSTRSGVMLALGYQAGSWNGGMHNISAYALELNRQAASVQQRLVWNDVFQGFFLRASYLNLDNHTWGSFGWSNRHTIAETRYTNAKGEQLRREYRVRLNEVSLEFGVPLYKAHLRPGLGADFGLFRASMRQGKEGEDLGDWESIHVVTSDSFLEPGRLSPTAGLTLFCDVVPFSQRGAGLTLRPYYQWHLIQPDLFGRAGSFDSGSYQYRANNYGLALSYSFSSLHP